MQFLLNSIKNLGQPNPADDPRQYFEFVASQNGNNVNFFGWDSIPENTYYEVNGVRQESAINSLTFSTGDTVKIVYGLNKVSTFSCNSKDYLRSITAGRIPTITGISLYRCFMQCSSLTSIPEGLFDNNPNVIEFTSCFQDCSSLVSIPIGLFDNNPNAKDFSFCFENCSSLTSIPKGLFDKNIAVTDFSSCFRGCSNLTLIPEGLFNNNPNIIDISSCFRTCTSLTSIPEGLFDNNTLATDFRNCFYYCTSLNSIPLSLFDKNTLATDFRDCFNRCSNLIVVVQIGSTADYVNASSFADDTKSTGTVYCRAGSNAYKEFSTTSTTNVDVLTY